MLSEGIKHILSASAERGWVLEPEAKRLLSLAGLEVPRFKWANDPQDALGFARETGYPVVAKVVSSQALHKSDVGGVTVGIQSDEKLCEAFERFRRFPDFQGTLVEEMLSGVELIVGSKMDYQFGPVILLGIGGTGVEIYRDTSLRMAPLNEKDVQSMVKGLRAHQLLEGYRGSEKVHLGALTRLLMDFSNLVMEVQEHIASMDLNPVMCSSTGCVVADARIMLKSS